MPARVPDFWEGVVLCANGNKPPAAAELGGKGSLEAVGIVGDVKAMLTDERCQGFACDELLVAELRVVMNLCIGLLDNISKFKEGTWWASTDLDADLSQLLVKLINGVVDDFLKWRLRRL